MLIPCIDLERGRVVQRRQGRRRVLTVSAPPLEVARQFAGQPWIHVIDLDAAQRTGSNARLVRALCQWARRTKGPRIRVGGGIATVRRACQVLDWGAEQVIIGTAAFLPDGINHRFLQALVRACGRQRIVVAVDTWRQRVVVEGWRRRLRLRPEPLLSALEPYCWGFLCTVVEQEGTLAGTPLAWFRRLRRMTARPLIAAGGIRRWEQVEQLERMGIDAAVGLAVYLGYLQLPTGQRQPRDRRAAVGRGSA